MIVVIPSPALVANPVEFTVATPVAVEAHVAVPVRFWELPSVKVPVAVNCWVVPNATEGLPGVTAIEVSAAAVTVRLSVPVTEPKLAEMVTDPCAKVCPKPMVLIVAMALLEELQVAELVRF